MFLVNRPHDDYLQHTVIETRAFTPPHLRHVPISPSSPFSHPARILANNPFVRRQHEKAVLQGARAFSTAASPSTSAMNAVVARAMLPGLAATLASVGTFKVRHFGISSCAP